MKTWQYLVMVVMIVILLVLVASMVPDGQVAYRQLASVALSIVSWVLSIALFLAIIFAPFVIGLLFALMIQKADDRIEPERTMTGGAKILPGVLFSVIMGLVWLIVIPIAAQNFLVWAIFAALGRYNGHYETSPIWWFVWSFLICGGGYWMSSSLDS
jgi:hypothetical protein